MELIIAVVAFVAGIFEQGEEGGELVYKYGMNVEQVKVLDDELFDLKEELEEATEKTEVSIEVEKTETVEVDTISETPEGTTPVEMIQETVTESVKMKVEEVLPTVKETVETLKVEGMPEEMVQPEIATH